MLKRIEFPSLKKIRELSLEEAEKIFEKVQNEVVSEIFKRAECELAPEAMALIDYWKKWCSEAQKILKEKEKEFKIKAKKQKAEKENLRTQIHLLNKKILQKTNEAFESVKKKAKNKVNELEKQITELDRKIEKLFERHGRLQVKLEETHKKFWQTQKKYEQLKKELENMEKQLEKLEKIKNTVSRQTEESLERIKKLFSERNELASLKVETEVLFLNESRLNDPIWQEIEKLRKKKRELEKRLRELE